MSADIELRHRQGDFTLDAAFAFGDAAGVTALFGPSGAGKSTVIHALAGLLRPQQGRILVQGETLLDTARGLFVPASARRIGVVFQDTRLFPHLTVRSNLLYGWRRSPARAGAQTIDAIIALLGLESLLPRRPRHLSGGERSRVALARALLMNPRALLLDEPLAALDAPRKAEILPYLERLVRETKIPMLYVSHALDEVARLADRMVVLDAGRVVAEGSLFDVTARLDLFTGAHRLPGAVLEAVIAGHDTAHDLTELAFDGEILVVPAIGRKPGDKVRIRIDADDVMLALARPEGVSANNVLAATIAAIRDDGANADVQLRLKEGQLVARITRRSVERLALKPGMNVFALIKSVTVGGREQG
ncbi:MAG TPA: molybdenum ABC transporter ATP-binding protein [Micropepsaceae bacterium]|jgi:molybdate transport system ATP-binding protein|nr:molybdenum ABC transporter ATP-binding protein [Micropepsaceae bacterium]